MLEPFGERRADVRAGVIAATVYNMNRGSNAPALGPDDFLGTPDPVEAKTRRAGNLSEKIKAALGGGKRK